MTINTEKFVITDIDWKTKTSKGIGANANVSFRRVLYSFTAYCQKCDHVFNGVLGNNSFITLRLGGVNVECQNCHETEFIQSGRFNFTSFGVIHERSVL